MSSSTCAAVGRGCSSAPPAEAEPERGKGRIGTGTEVGFGSVEAASAPTPKSTEARSTFEGTATFSVAPPKRMNWSVRRRASRRARSTASEQEEALELEPADDMQEEALELEPADDMQEEALELEPADDMVAVRVAAARAAKPPPFIVSSTKRRERE